MKATKSNIANKTLLDGNLILDISIYIHRHIFSCSSGLGWLMLNMWAHMLGNWFAVCRRTCSKLFCIHAILRSRTWVYLCMQPNAAGQRGECCTFKINIPFMVHGEYFHIQYIYCLQFISWIVLSKKAWSVWQMMHWHVTPPRQTRLTNIEHLLT